MELLTRDDFRNGVFKRDRHLCVNCGYPGVDSHHIMERRLWPDGGYYIDNGATVCEPCHIQAEMTNISCETLREKAGIKQVLLPPHLYSDQRYDKWGNPIMPNGERLRGELSDDDSVKKVLEHVTYSSYIKYPRTYHLPWSPGCTEDDRIMPDITCFADKEVVVTTKMDGENTTMYRDHIHARSIDSGNHPSRNRVKAIWGSIAHEIPEHYRVCGENLFAKHSIAYDNLAGYFEVFSVWNKLTCLPWDETEEWAALLGLPMVPVLYRGFWDKDRIHSFYKEGMEGYVVRLASSFPYGQFRFAVGKYVRANHVQTHGHWMRQEIVPNKLRA